MRVEEDHSVVPKIAHPAVILGIATALLGMLMSVVFVGSAASAQGSDAVVATPWKLVYEHYDERIGEGGAGIDIVTSEARRPLALAGRPRGTQMHFRGPEFSPDGTYVAYIRSFDHEELFVIRSDGTGRKLLASGEFRNYVWSPDGTKLAVAADCGQDFQGGCRRGHVDIIRRDGSAHRVLARPAGLSVKAEIELQGWSRRDAILYRVEDRGRGRLYSLSTGGARSPVLADSRKGGDLGEAAWSPEGNRIAYKRGCTHFRSETFCDVAVMERDGGSKRLLWSQKEPIGRPSYEAATWIPGSNLLLVSLWGSPSQTRLLDASTGSSRRYSKAPWDTITVSADGARVATIDNQIVGIDHIVVTRSDGSILTRSAVPPQVPLFQGDDQELWIG